MVSNDEQDWRGPMPSFKLTLPDDLNLADAFKDFDFAKLKKDVAREALREPKRLKKVAPDVEALVEEAALSTVNAYRGRSGVAGARAAKKTLKNKLVHRRLAKAEQQAAIDRYEIRCVEIITGGDGAALLEKIKRWV